MLHGTLLLCQTYVLIILNLSTCEAEISTEILFQKSLKGLERVTNFYERHATEMNLDGVFGARLAADWLYAFLRKFRPQCGNCSSFQDELLRIKIIQRKLDEAAEKGTKHDEDSEPEYFKVVGFLLKKNVWKKMLPIKRVPNVETSLSFTLSSSFDENASDGCMRQIYNSCQISDACWKRMTNLYGSEYNVTHDILFMLFGIQLGCSNTMESKSFYFYNESLDTRLGLLCANVLKEAKKIAENKFPTYEKDLFMEQILSCGLGGYIDFFQKMWFENILSWQAADGCFGNASVSRRRKKRRAWIMTNGCDTHTTAVAIITLAEYIAYEMESFLLQNQFYGPLRF